MVERTVRQLFETTTTNKENDQKDVRSGDRILTGLL